MTPILGLLLILLIAFIGTRIFSEKAILKAPLLSGLIVSGIPYILLGVVLGPYFFNFLNPTVLENLQPLLSLALGWVGLLFGIQLRWRNIRRFPRNYLLFTSVQSFVSLLIIFVILLIGGWLLGMANRPMFLIMTITLAALGSNSAMVTIGRIVVERRVHGRLTHLLQFVTSLDGYWAILVGGLAISAHWLLTDLSPIFRWGWLGLAFTLPILIGYLFHKLIQIRFQSEELLLLVLGLVIFTSGLGFYFKISPIFLTMILGITLAQFPRDSEKIMRVVRKAEKPIYLFMLVFAGAMWNYRFWTALVFITIFIVARTAGKYLGGWISAGTIDCRFPIPSRVGGALLSFGGTSLAIAFNYQIFFPGHLADIVMSATILGTLLFDEYAAFATVNLLKRQGEL